MESNVQRYEDTILTTQPNIGLNRTEAAKWLVQLLIVLTVCILAGSMISSLFTQQLGMTQGHHLSTGHLRLSLLVLHSFSFLIPSVVFIIIASKTGALHFFRIPSGLKPSWIMMGFLMLVLLIPIIQYSYELNQMVDLPTWMNAMESSANETIVQMLKMENTSVLLLNICLMAILPALGEELLFRGIIQRIGYAFFRNPQVSIWITALLFSAVHFQFAGFLPRFLLGLFLGYLYYWTEHLMLPIVIHFFNNAGMLLMAYLDPTQISEIENPAVSEIPWYVVILSILLLIPTVQYFKKVKSGLS